MKEFDDFNFSVEKCKYSYVYLALISLLISTTFPDTKDLTRECVGGSDLQQRKKEIEAYNETTAATLKQTCKKNYMEFIQTAKEISRSLRPPISIYIYINMFASQISSRKCINCRTF